MAGERPIASSAANSNLADWVGTGVWILSSMLFLMYGQIWFGDPDAFIAKPKPSSVLQQWRHAKAESKLQAAELRCGVVFALIGGVTAAGANASDFLICVVTLGCSILGGLAGYDLKRRVMGRRKRLTTEESKTS